MTYTVSGAHFNQENIGGLGGFGKTEGTSINYKENKASSAVSGSFAAVVVSGANNQANQGNTYESLLKEADDVKGQIMASASTAKLSLKALMMKLSGSEAVRIDEDGFNLTDASEDKMVNIIEKIRIELAMHCDDYVAYGNGVSKDAIESVAGSAGMANNIEAKMHDARLAVNEESVSDVNSTMDKLSTLQPLTEDVKNVMVAENIAPTIDGITQASSGAGKINMRMANENNVDFEKIRHQVEQVIERAGLEVNEQNLGNAKGFIEKGIPVTKENLIYKAELDSLDINSLKNDSDKVLNKIFDNMRLGNSAGSTSLIDRASVLDEVRDGIETLEKAELSDVREVIETGKTFTIASLKLSINARLGINNEYESNNLMSLEAVSDEAVKAYNSMIETRILMTAQAGVFLAKNNVSIMATPIHELNALLKDYDKKNMELLADEELLTEDGTIDDLAYDSVNEVRKALFTINYSSVEIFKNVVSEDAGQIVTLSALSYSGNNYSRQYARANNTYEAVGTEVRKDLGDSIKTAIANSTDSIIEEIGLEGTKPERDAIRILAMNNMDITEKNIDKIKEVNTVLNNLIENMKPETVLAMIRDGINPMNADINELNQYLTNMNQQASEANEEKFAKFLFKLDRTRGIDDQQRKQFIGIYQMMNIFTKDAGSAVGALVKQGADITMKNLISAYSSRKHSGIDATIDDSTGMAEVSGEVNYYTALFAQSSNLITPNTLKNVDNTYGIADQSVDNFVQQLEDNYDYEAEKDAEQEYVKALTMAADANQTVLREIRRSESEVTIGNIQSVKAFLEAGQIRPFKGMKDESAFEKIGHKEDLDLLFEEMENDVKEELQEAISLSGDLDSEVELDYEEFLDLRMREREIGYIANLSRKMDYRIPYAKENGELGMLNLSLIQDGENKGRISIKMESSILGNISIEAKVDGRRLGLFLVTDKVIDEAAEDKIAELESNIAENFSMDDVKVYTSTAGEVPYVTYEQSGESNVPTDTLYEMASDIVKLIA